MLICPIFCPLLADLELDFERVERLDNRLVRQYLVLLLLHLLRLLPLNEVSFILSRLATFKLLGSHAPVLHLLHIRLERLHRLQLKSALVLAHLLKRLLSLLIQKIGLVHAKLCLVALLLDDGLLSLLPLLQLLLQSVKVIAHLPVDVYLASLHSVLLASPISSKARLRVRLVQLALAAHLAQIHHCL